MAEKREHILSVAEELFAEHGYEGTSVRTLASKAKVNVAMVGYYFGSKEKLFAALIEDRSTHMRQRIQLLNENAKLNAWQKMEILIDAFVDRLAQKNSFQKIIHRELSLSKRNDIQNSITNSLLKNAEHFKQLIHEGQRSKMFRTDAEPRFVIATLLGSLHMIHHNPVICHKQLTGVKSVEPNSADELAAQKNYLKQLLKSYLLDKPKKK